VRDAKKAFEPATYVAKKDGKHVVKLLVGEERTVEEKDKANNNQDNIFSRKTPKMAGPGTFTMRAVPNMDELSPLNMAEVLQNVDVLFKQGQTSNPGEGPAKIYSSVGPILIAMNPFEWLKIYDEAWMKAYHDAANNQMLLAKLGPHAYRTAEECYQILTRKDPVAVIICGESGSGKTVTNAKMLEYLCYIAQASGESIGADPDKITEACSVLEAFGNATTPRNDNSSRFGRFTRLYFENEDLNGAKRQVVCGCGTDSYLLERSRIP
jgi:myosin heavy subunit